MSDKVTTAASKYRSVEDYLAAERKTSARDEYLNGRIIAKSSVNRWHNRIVSNSAIAIGSRTSGQKFEIYISNMRVRLPNNLICYPDIVIVTGEPTFADAEMDLLLNPAIVIEVLSPLTQTCEKMQRLESLLAMESVRECLFIKQDEMRAEHYSRQNPKQWIYKIYNEREDVVSIDSIGCKISMQEIYAHIKLERPAMAPPTVN
ncbi:MAG: hypothetical protein C4325_09200 [Blastocatellia bacterium]